MDNIGLMSETVNFIQGSPNQRPSNVITGTMFKNTEIGKWEIFNGSSWENLDTPTNEWATIE